MKVKILTLGCKVNQYESQTMLDRLTAEGFDPCDKEERADVVIINSCTVTATGDQKTRQTLRRARREYPDAVIVLTGCMPQAFPECAETLPEADIVIGNSNRAAIGGLIEQFLLYHNRIVSIVPHTKEYGDSEGISSFRERTRVMLKIEDGCNRFCSYCIIPYARGRVRSKPLEAISAELDALPERYKEIVLTGINLSAYGQDIGITLYEAAALACSKPNIERVRFGSLEPDLLTDEMIHRLASLKKICPQFHLSLQSGCDRTLRAMNRRYTCAEYEHVCSKLRTSFDNASITTDIMVGFPGETEEDFAESCDFLTSIRFARAHVFAYSRRPGTRAAEFGGQITNAEKERRSALMIAAASESEKEFLRSQVGREVRVLVERTEHGISRGYSENYTEVLIENPSGLELDGRIVSCVICSAGETSCTGKLI